MKKILGFSAILAFACLFASCDNDFLSIMRGKIDGEASSPGLPPFVWSTNTLYVEPTGYLAVSPVTISGSLNNNGLRVWFSSQVLNRNFFEISPSFSDSRLINTTEPFGVTLAGASNTQLLLTFDADGTPDPTNLPETYSIAVKPSALYGADKASFDLAAATLNLNIVVPTYAGWAKQRLEVNDFSGVGITKAWGSGGGETAEEEIANLKNLVIADVAAAAKELLWYAGVPGNTIGTNITNPEIDGEVPAAGVDDTRNVFWAAEPDLSAGYIDKDSYTFNIVDFGATDDNSIASAQLSIPVEFTSVVGDSIALLKIKDGDGIGSVFNIEYDVDSSTTLGSFLTNFNTSTYLAVDAAYNTTACHWITEPTEAGGLCQLELVIRDSSGATCPAPDGSIIVTVNVTVS
jgi:hypothetical protein